MTDLNEAGRAYARTLIAAGKVDKASAWAFSPEDGDALLGAGGQDWTTYSKVHLGVDRAATDKTKARWTYPVVKGGKVFREGLIAAESRAAAQGDAAVASAAKALLEQIDGPAKGKSAADAAPASGLIEVKAAPFEFKFLDNEPEGTFEGYGSVFDNEDDGGDLMLSGAFDRTLAQHRAVGTMPKMLLNHGGLGGGMFASPSPEDMLPIGKWKDMQPDTHGLHGKGRLINLDTESGKRTYGAMREQELKDMSIMYAPRDFTYGKKPNEPRRTLKAVDLLEMGPVTFPMNRLATINAVKSGRLTLSAHELRELEAVLRDADLSRADAVKACAAFKTWLQREAEAPEPALRDAATTDDLRSLAERIRAAAA